MEGGEGVGRLVSEGMGDRRELLIDGVGMGSDAFGLGPVPETEDRRIGEPERPVLVSLSFLARYT